MFSMEFNSQLTVLPPLVLVLLMLMLVVLLLL